MSKTVIDRNYLESQAKNSNDAVLDGGFSQNTRSMDIVGWNEGDIFVIPTDFKVYRNSQLSSDERSVEYTIVLMVDDNGKETGEARMFYPSAFQRALQVYAKGKAGLAEPVAGQVMKASGTVVDHMQSYPTIQEGIKALAGKPIKISKVTRFQTRNFTDDTKLANGKVMQFDFV